MKNLEYIEDFFNGEPSAEEKFAFENRILSDAQFAEDVSFYISAKAVLKEKADEEKREEFRKLYENQRVISIKRRPVAVWKYLAVAAIVLVVSFTVWFSIFRTTPHHLAENYIDKNFQTLGVTMGNRNEKQDAIQLYNTGDLNGAFRSFAQLHEKDPDDPEVLKYAGISALRSHNYDKAIEYFSTLESIEGLYSNPGKFYLALTLLQRNEKSDKEKSKLLLQQVVEQNLEGKSVAEKWLKKY